jgi:FlaA1/EpsC-like NDP-sugar epimerase
MIKNLIERFSRRFLSRWIVLAIDFFFVLVLFQFALLLSFNFEPKSIEFSMIYERNLYVSLVYCISFLIFGSYKGIIRQTGFQDVFLIVKSTTHSLLVLIVLSGFKETNVVFAVFGMPRSIMFIHYLLVLFVLLSFRFVIKSTFNIALKQNSSTLPRTKVIIFGSGAAGEITKQSLTKELGTFYEVVAYIDDNPTKQGKIQDGIPVLSREKALTEDFVTDNWIDQLIIAVQNINPAERQKIIQRGMDLQLNVKVVPQVSNWINGELTFKQIKSVRIEDLLERDLIKLNSVNISRELNDQVIMVTGAAGSIGSEILRQILHYSPKEVIAIDHAESGLYDIEMELLNHRPNHHLVTRFVVADITRKERMDHVFAKWQPDIIFHAAAYKHVPLMEAHPYEAVKVNVMGTKRLADLAVKCKVKKFVMVSTDKAVNPTNVMGASKRLAEMYVQNLSSKAGSTQFITTRFGNVLGSNGSVIPLFRKQIERGGPITITHPEITRYFMTIPEACNLVLEAGAMGKGGEIYVFDMGESVKIIDLAKNMIRLSGLTLGKDIDIKFTGLRPGEKLYEELLSAAEDTRPTHHEKILIADVRKVDSEQLEYILDGLKLALISGDSHQIVGLIKSVVKEFKSNNSEYSRLD